MIRDSSMKSVTSTSDPAGMIGKAAAGTLFLDEIGDLAVESQIKLLRLLQEKEYHPLGADISLKTDARFVFATNKDLEDVSSRGEFRRLDTIGHNMNREAPELIAELIRDFVRQISEDG